MRKCERQREWLSNKSRQEASTKKQSGRGSFTWARRKAAATGSFSDSLNCEEKDGVREEAGGTLAGPHPDAKTCERQRVHGNLGVRQVHFPAGTKVSACSVAGTPNLWGGGRLHLRRSTSTMQARAGPPSWRCNATVHGPAQVPL